MFNDCFLSTFLNKIQLVVINVTLFSPFFQETIETIGVRPIYNIVGLPIGI